MTETNRSPLPQLTVLLLLFAVLLAIAEHTGLPSGWVRGFLCILAFLAIISAIVLTRTMQESTFFGRIQIVPGIAAAVLLSTMIATGVDLLISPSDPVHWLAMISGSLAGFAFGFTIKRWQAGANANGLDKGGPQAARPSLPRGVGLIALGGAIAVIAIAPAAAEGSWIFAISAPAAATITILIALGTVLAGGGRGSFGFSRFLTTLSILAIASLLAVGMNSFGQLPLPDFSSPQTLLSIAEARSRWNVTSPISLIQWPSLQSLQANNALAAFAVSALVSAAMTSGFAPAVPVHRRGTAILTMILLVVVPLAVIAIAGYAVEAAAVQFVGTPIARAPSGLVEAARLGLVEVCQARPDTAEAVRIACGISPRDARVFEWNQIRLDPAFIVGGLSATLDYPTTFNLVTGSFRLCLYLALTVLGLWMAARGLGGDILARNRTAAGLASLRLGQTRLAALLLAGALAFQWATISVPALWLMVAAATGAVLVLIPDLDVIIRRSIARPAVAKEVPAPPKRQSKKRISTDGKTA